jgi:hypothetical protein
VGSFAQPEDFCPAILIKKSFFESPPTVGFQKTIFNQFTEVLRHFCEL